MIVYVVFIFIIFVLCLTGEELKKNKWLFIAFIGLFMVLFSGLRGEGVATDDIIFKGYYKELLPLKMMFTNPNAFFHATHFPIEPTFIIIGSVLKAIFPTIGFHLLIFLYALAAVALKIKAITKYSEFIFFSLFIYACNFFLLHDMTQIRAGLAFGIVMMGFEPLVERKFGKYLCIVLLATTFHYSALFFLLFYFFNTKKISTIAYLLILFIPMFLATIHLDPTSIMVKYDLGIYSEKVRMYKEIQSWKHDTISLYNVTTLLLIAISLFLLYYKNELAEKTKYGILFLKINIMAIAVFFLFSGLVVFAWRLFEMLCIVQIFLFPYLIYFIKPRWLGELVVVLLGIALFYNQLFLQGLFSEYHLVFFH